MNWQRPNPFVQISNWPWCLPRDQWSLWFLITIRSFVWTILTGWKILSCSIRKITTFCSFSHLLWESQRFPAQDWFAFCRCSMGVLFHETTGETGQSFTEAAVRCFQLFNQETFRTHESQNWDPKATPHSPQDNSCHFSLTLSRPSLAMGDSYAFFPCWAPACARENLVLGNLHWRTPKTILLVLSYSRQTVCPSCFKGVF